VRLVCGAPASGKSTYVKNHAEAGDLVIDLDLIARERGFGRARPPSAIATLLAERNRRLAALACEPPERLAWVILSAPSQSLRGWWCAALGVAADDLIVLTPSREELRRRIIADPDRRTVRESHMVLVDKWIERERANDPGIIKTGSDAAGLPTDPLHPWNRIGRGTK
jgi:5-methylcytosine-specific restriction protein A